MGLPRPTRLARLAAGAALHATATGVGLTAGTATLAGSLTTSLLTPPARGARAAAESAVHGVSGSATGLVRAAGRFVTGADDAADVTLERIAEAGRSMFDPPTSRSTGGYGSPRDAPIWSWPRPRSRAIRRCGARCGGTCNGSTASSGPR